MNTMSEGYADELFDYGRTLYQMERYAEAKEQFLLASELEATYYVYYWLYRSCKELGQADEAMGYLGLCYNENDIDMSISVMYAEELAEREEYKKAVNVLEHTLDVNDYDENVDEFLHELKEKLK